MGKVTIDDLVVLINKFFKTMECGFGAVNKKFEAVNKATDRKIEELAVMIARGFGETSDKINGIDNKINKIDDKLIESENRTKGIIRGEIRALENTVNSNHGAMISEFIKIHDRVDNIEEKFDQISERTLKDDNIFLQMLII